MSIAPSYQLSRVVLSVNGVPIEGYADQDEAIGFERSAEAAEMVVGAGGFAVASISDDRSMVATISLSQLAPSYRYLAGLMQAQLDSPGPLVAVTFAMRDLNNGDEVVDAGAFFLSRPTRGKRKRAGFAEFKIGLPRPREKFGTTILGGL